MSGSAGGRAYKWSEMPWEVVRPGVQRTGVGTADVTLVMNRIAVGAEARPHSHADFMQIALIVAGRGIYQVGDQRNEVGPDSVVLIPAGVEHYIENTGPEPILNVDVFAPPRADYGHLTNWMKLPD